MRRSLVLVAGAAALCRNPWWVIAGAATALHGAIADTADIDMLMSLSDAQRFATRHALRPRVSSNARFRSAVLLRWEAALLSVEVMAGFEAKVARGWRSMTPVTRERVMIGDAALFVPSADELAATYRAWGRPQDLIRAALLG